MNSSNCVRGGIDSVASTAASPVGALIVPDGGYRIDNPQLILVAAIMRIFA